MFHLPHAWAVGPRIPLPHWKGPAEWAPLLRSGHARTELHILLSRADQVSMKRSQCQMLTAPQVDVLGRYTLIPLRCHHGHERYGILRSSPGASSTDVFPPPCRCLFFCACISHSRSPTYSRSQATGMSHYCYFFPQCCARGAWKRCPPHSLASFSRPIQQFTRWCAS